MSTSTQHGERYIPEWTAGDRLRRIRRDTSLNQEAFAKQLGLGAQRYSAWESGRNQPPLTEFIAVAKRIELLTGVPAEWTLGLEMRNAPQPDGPGGVTDERARRDSNPKPSDPKVLPLRVA